MGLKCLHRPNVITTDVKVYVGLEKAPPDVQQETPIVAAAKITSSFSVSNIVKPKASSFRKDIIFCNR